MLCNTCPIRSKCHSPCPELLADLGSIEKSLQEIVFSKRQIIAHFDENIVSKFQVHENYEEEIKINSLEDVINKEVSKLPSRQQECIELKFWQNLTECEIAEQIGTSRRTVRIHISRALEKIYKKMKNVVSSDDYPSLHDQKRPKTDDFCRHFSLLVSKEKIRPDFFSHAQ